MTHTTSYHQIGRFVVSFQRVEAALTDLIILVSHSDDEAIRILINELAFAQRVKAVEVLFARFIDLRLGTAEAEKTAFHAVMIEIGELAQRRNEIVHSTYATWQNVDGAIGLLRTNSKLRAKQGSRQESEEELLPQAFEPDFARLSAVSEQLEKFRLRVIGLLYQA